MVVPLRTILALTPHWFQHSFCHSYLRPFGILLWKSFFFAKSKATRSLIGGLIHFSCSGTYFCFKGLMCSYGCPFLLFTRRFFYLGIMISQDFSFSSNFWLLSVLCWFFYPKVFVNSNKISQTLKALINLATVTFYIFLQKSRLFTKAGPDPGLDGWWVRDRGQAFYKVNKQRKWSDWI